MLSSFDHVYGNNENNNGFMQPNRWVNCEGNVGDNCVQGRPISMMRCCLTSSWIRPSRGNRSEEKGSHVKASDRWRKTSNVTWSTEKTERYGHTRIEKGIAFVAEANQPIQSEPQTQLSKAIKRFKQIEMLSFRFVFSSVQQTFAFPLSVIRVESMKICEIWRKLQTA